MTRSTPSTAAAQPRSGAVDPGATHLHAALHTGAIARDLASFQPVDAERTTFTSRVSRIRGYTYTGEELALFVKVSRSDVDPEITAAFAREIEFYASVAPQLDVPLLTYHGGDYQPATGSGFVVLDDVSATHAGLEWPVAPRPGDAIRAVGWLARLHAACWRADMLADLASPAAPADRIAETTRAFLGFLGSRLPVPARRRLARATASIDSWYPRFATAEPQVLLFGDAHFSNFLYARTPHAGSPVLPCDWQHWGVGAPGYDLANLMALHWPPQRRQRYELRLLRTYLRVLHGHGVTGYTWDDLLRDYREHVYRHVVVVPAWQWAVGVPATVWWPQLEWGLDAWFDLDVDALWSG